MQREIKFRAWNKHENQLVEEMLFQWQQRRTDAEMAVQIEARFDLREEFISELTERYVLMQFTGLKDKNGKEIYEGDWCRFTSRGFDFEIQQGFVKYIRSAFRAVIDGEDEDDLLTLDRYYHIEVIGNIYENPELNKLI